MGQMLLHQSCVSVNIKKLNTTKLMFRARMIIMHNSFINYTIIVIILCIIQIRSQQNSRHNPAVYNSRAICCVGYRGIPPNCERKLHTQ